MKKTKIVSRKKENMTFKGFPTKFKEGITCLIASIILMYIALAGPADGLASYVGLGFSGVFMFLSIGFASTDMNVYKTMYSSYFAINALFLFSIFLISSSVWLSDIYESVLSLDDMLLISLSTISTDILGDNSALSSKSSTVVHDLSARLDILCLVLEILLISFFGSSYLLDICHISKKELFPIGSIVLTNLFNLSAKLIASFIYCGIFIAAPWDATNSLIESLIL